MLRRTFLGLMSTSLFPGLYRVDGGVEKILSLPDKRTLVITLRDNTTECLDYLQRASEQLNEVFKNFNVLIINDAGVSVVGEKQTYFNWQTMTLPLADLYLKETGEQIIGNDVWVETKLGLVGSLNEHHQIEVYQYPGELEVRFK